MLKAEYIAAVKRTEGDMNNYVHNIVWLRKHYGYSKRKMAEVLGISVNSMNKIENGEFPSRLNPQMIFNISEHFGVSVSDMLKSKWRSE